MADKHTAAVEPQDHNQVVVDRAKDFWSQYNRPLIIALVVIILLGGGYFAYKYLYKAPQEEKASAAMFKAEEYFRADSLEKALNGDGIEYGFLKVIDKYGSTEAGNLAKYYAGVCYVQLDQNEQAVKYLKDFSTSAKQVQARAYKLLGDAYADLGKQSDALDNYKKAAHHFKEDNLANPEYYLVAGYYAQKVMNNKEEATELYHELVDQYGSSQQALEAKKYLAEMGVYQ